MTDWYMLVDGEPVKAKSMAEWNAWARSLPGDYRKLARTDFPSGTYVSTVFLGLDHRFGDGPPVLWETLVFGGPLADEMERYESVAAALDGHEAMVNRVGEAEGSSSL